jgi:hypothetical protein
MIRRWPQERDGIGELHRIAEFTGFELQLGFSQGPSQDRGEDPLMVDNEFLFSSNGARS